MTADTALNNRVHCPKSRQYRVHVTQASTSSTFVFQSVVAFHLWGKWYPRPAWLNPVQILH